MNKTFGALLLIAGCSIGAGMLGLPSVTGASGFIPSSFFFALAWAFMAMTGLVLAEVTLSFKTPQISFISMTESTLGQVGKISTWILFSLLFYTIMVAYFIGGGLFVADFIEFSTGYALPLPLASAILGIFFFIAIFRGISSVDWVNRYLMLGLFLCYVLLLFVGFPHIETKRLLRADWEGASFAIPILIICFGFHNLVPSLTSYLDQDAKKIKKVIIIGSLIPLGIYLLWEFVILGVVPFEAKAEWIEAQGKGELITQVLARASNVDEVVLLARGFAFFAIATSFLPVAFSFFDFLRDALAIKEAKKNRFFLTSAVLVLPLVIAETHPDSFLVALEYAGGVCAVSLFGLLPVLMAMRRRKMFQFKLATQPVLITLFIGSLAIITMTVLHRIGKI